MKRFVMAMTIAVLVANLPTAAQAQTAKPAFIKPGKVFEKCMALEPPQKIEYRFESATKLNFNLHYQKGDQTYYPVKLDRTNGESGLYEAKAKEVYCLMWENKTSADIELVYSARIVK